MGAGTKPLMHPQLLSQAPYRGAGLIMEQSGLEPARLWDAVMSDRGYITIPAPTNIY